MPQYGEVAALFRLHGGHRFSGEDALTPVNVAPSPRIAPGLRGGDSQIFIATTIHLSRSYTPRHQEIGREIAGRNP